ncbi:MAG: sensor histidine kinase [Hasllibacter sp.]
MTRQDAPSPGDERLEALREQGILDTPREEAFDEIARLAARLCDAPVALVSLIDETRQWFKAAIGLDQRETPLSQSICRHVVADGNALEVPDTRADPRTADDPVCVGTRPLHFYSGAPITLSSGHPVGSLCVLDHEPRSLTPGQRETLAVLARQVAAQIELRRALNEAEMLRREIDHRVKNSLAAMSSAIRMKARNAGPETGAALGEVATQIASLSALHDMLGLTDGPGHVALDEYLPSVADLLRGALPPGLTLRTDFAPFATDRVAATSIATVLNEAVANGAKHSGGTGRITVNGREVPAGYELTVTNAAPAERAARPGGLGLRIMRAVAEQAGGSLEAGPGAGGWTVTMRLPHPTGAGRAAVEPV